jgi:formate-dependent nitrite reductase membrane component NrfD
LWTIAAPVVALAGTAVTGVLLVWDLKQPKRFFYLLTKPHLTSWLVWGAVALGVFAAVSFVWLLAGIVEAPGLITALAWVAIPSGALVAGYTGFLFGQAEGRDLWQSPLLFWHLVVQAVMVGAGALAVIAPSTHMVGVTLAVATGTHVLMLLLEYSGGHASRNAATAAHMITRGRYARLFWLGGVALATVACGLAVADVLLPVAGIAVQIALIAYESVFVRAGQDVPLS